MVKNKKLLNIVTNKKGKSTLTILSIVIILAVIISSFAVLAQEGNDNASDSGDNGLTLQEKQDIKQKVKEVAGERLAQETQKYVEEFVEKRGIGAEDINNISEVDISNLPQDVNIENVNDANLAIYQVDYNETAGANEQIFVITYSSKKLGDQGDIIVAKDKRQFLHFGLSDETAGSTFLETATGVPGSIGVGYVMIRHGSITGLSTLLEVIDAVEDEDIEVIVYKNDEVIRFGNVIYASLDGIKKDYDVQSKGVVEFEPGDVVSVFINTDNLVKYKNVITMVEITTTE